MTDALCDKVREALAAADPTDSKELKQISSIMKEIMAMQDICSAEERRERELRVAKLEREAEASEGNHEVTVCFCGEEELAK